MARKIVNRVTKKEFRDMMPELDDQTIEYVWEVFSSNTVTGFDIVDYSSECEMCGKPMPYRSCGMCTHCETVWNG